MAAAGSATALTIRSNALLDLSSLGSALLLMPRTHATLGAMAHAAPWEADRRLLQAAMLLLWALSPAMARWQLSGTHTV